MYRIVQEALTNVIKHAGRVRATVLVSYTDDAVTVEVDDEGGPHPSRGRTRLDAAVRGAWAGPVGMRERVAMYRATSTWGLAPGGFHVAARFPFGAST